MRRLALILVLLTSFFAKMLANPELSIKLNLDYDSNVFSLSQTEQDEGKGLAFVETTDDFIQRLKLRLSDKYTPGSITISPYIDVGYANYLNNTDKNNLSLLAGGSVRYDKMWINTTLGYNPNTYLREYSGRPYEYSKAMVRLSGGYRFHKLAIPLLYYKFEQYKHNEYFKEYDAPTHTVGLGWRFMTKFVNTDIMYYYRGYATDDDDIKDGSYKSNIYSVRLRTKRFYRTAFDYRLYGNFIFEDRYFQSELPNDSYHFARIDKTTSFGVGTDLWLSRHLNLRLDYKYRVRKLDSENPKVVSAKEYDRYNISTTLEYHFGF